MPHMDVSRYNSYEIFRNVSNSILVLCFYLVILAIGALKLWRLNLMDAFSPKFSAIPSNVIIRCIHKS